MLDIPVDAQLFYDTRCITETKKSSPVTPPRPEGGTSAYPAFPIWHYCLLL